MIIKKFLKYKWYRIKHLDELIPKEYKEAYDMINSGVPMGIVTTMTILNIVENITEGNIDNPINKKEIDKNVEYVEKQFLQNSQKNNIYVESKV